MTPRNSFGRLFEAGIRYLLSFDRKKRFPRPGVLVGCAVAVLLAGNLAQAATVSLNESVNSSNWNTGGIWFGANPDGTPTAIGASTPAAGDVVYVGFQSNPAMNAVTFNVVGPVFSSVILNSGTATTFTLSQTAAATLLQTGTEILGTTRAGAVYDLVSGTNVVSGTLAIGTGTTGQGKYHLGAGTTAVLNVGYIALGGNAVSDQGGNQIVQDGGKVTVNNDLRIACTGSSTGFYTLNSGSLNAPTEFIGYSGTGSFTQTGGTNSITNGLSLGYNASSSGTYNLSAGSLGSQNEYVGYFGTGAFTQTGGTNSITSGLSLGYNASSSGTYNFSSGSLGSQYVYIGQSGTGTFTHSGGTLSVGNALQL